MKQKNLKKKTGILLLAIMMIVSMLSKLGAKVHAAELPDVSQFATVDELKTLNTDDTDGEQKSAKVYFGNYNYNKWWIAGSQSDDSLVLFASIPMEQNQQFDLQYTKNKTYSSNWKCSYIDGIVPSEVYPNHYGGSPLRNTLQDLETTHFTPTEQILMKESTIYTYDSKNNKVYSTTNKLYLPYGKSGDNYFTVGINNPNDLNTGLRIDTNYWPILETWTRAPHTSDYSVVSKKSSSKSLNDILVTSKYSIVPAFELNISSVLFGSLVKAVTSEGELSLDTGMYGAMTLRYNTDSIGSAVVLFDRSKVELTNVPTGTYLVAQNSDGAWSKKINDETFISADTMGLDSFKNCKVWLETSNSSENMTYATMATEEQGYTVNIVDNTGLTIVLDNGVQEVEKGTDIQDIIVQANDGYYLPDNYSDTVVLPSGLSIVQNENEITISGIPTNDVDITLPAATVKPKSDTPEVEIGKTSTAIIVNATNYKTDFGKIEYKLNNGQWEEDDTILINLTPNTEYTLSIRYTGQGIYRMSDEKIVKVITLKDGNEVIVVPVNLAIDYKENLKLSGVILPSGWTWVEPETYLNAGKETYKARFDTTNLEAEYDFAGVQGYNAQTHYVERGIEVNVLKGESSIQITTDDMNKTYDGSGVIEPTYTTSGSTGNVTIAWQKNISHSDIPKWEDLEGAPRDAGEYQVVVTLEEDNNYNSATTTKTFVIAQAMNEWTEELSIEDWTYNETASVPNVKSKYGEVVFTYSNQKERKYTSEVPVKVGTYYVKASVSETENYTGLEEVVSFAIKKAIPIPEKITGLMIGKGQALKEIQLPRGFEWKDESIIATELGRYQYEAVYTPVDISNYEIIEVMLEVEVVAEMIPLNHIPIIQAEDKTVAVGDMFDDVVALEDVTATDFEDGDITKNIEVIKNEVDTTKVGVYEVTYKVTDSQGASTTKTITVVVKEKEVPSIDE
ncbi:MAG: DUF5011 domain-containing protein, partial [Erysipelotrichales bacterium]|nr:DUF5011 domain-containing protein [Erysipelotrichales bacterium]